MAKTCILFRIPLFYYFERWSKYLQLRNRWKLSFESIVIFQVHAIQQYKIDIFCRICKVNFFIKGQFIWKKLFLKIYGIIFFVPFGRVLQRLETPKFAQHHRESLIIMLLFKNQGRRETDLAFTFKSTAFTLAVVQIRCYVLALYCLILIGSNKMPL